MSWKTWITNELLTSSALNGNFEIVKDKTDLITAPVSGDETKLLKVNGTYDGFSLAEKMPNLISSDAGKLLKVNSTYDGYETLEVASGWAYNSGPVDITSQITLGTGYTAITTVQEAVIFSKRSASGLWYIDLNIDVLATATSTTAFYFIIGKSLASNIIPPPIYSTQRYNNSPTFNSSHQQVFSYANFTKTYSNSRGSFSCSILTAGTVTPTGFTLRLTNVQVASGLII